MSKIIGIDLGTPRQARGKPQINSNILGGKYE